MEDNFRNVLIILSAIVITAIFVHGLWTIRKQKNPYKLKTSQGRIDPITRDFDQKGFDQDGVGHVKVKFSESSDQENLDQELVAEPISTTGVQKTDAISPHQTVMKDDALSDLTEQRAEVKPEKDDNNSAQPLDSGIESDWFKDDTRESNQAQFTKGELGDELTASNRAVQQTKKSTEPKVPVHIEPLYEQPVTQAKPARTPISRVNKTSSKTSLKRDQMEIDFEHQQTKQATVQATEPKKVPGKIETQVIILSVVMPVNQQMFGAALLPSLLTLGLKYGEMNIFHRHEDNAGNGKVTFSLANIMNPGSFDLDTMESFATRGVSLFMTLPNAGDSFYVFEQMLNAAKQLAQEFNAQVLDDKRNVMTKQTEQHYLNKIREFDRMNRISLVE
ncbi:cell division protein ZipA [Colwellia piezophila]|uniref:cell division protein ZipA n=1 Tax=Colwellia piezophila TaxID=211668 RepID=UPI00036DA3DB|nr:cell division protein ZipA [Colwellia piezophila]